MRTAHLDFLWAFRVLRARWNVFVPAMVGLAMALGGSASVVTLLDVLVFRGPAVSAPETVVRARRVSTVGSSNTWPVEEYREALSLGNRVTAEAWTEGNAVYRTNADNIELPVGLVSGNFFHTFGVPASAGRVFTSEDDQPGTLVPVVLSHALWTRRLGGNESIIGEEVSIGAIKGHVLGVAARGFTGLDDPTDVDPVALWMPLKSVIAHADYQRQVGTAVSAVKVAARLAHGASLPEAQAELATLVAAWSDRAGLDDSPRAHLTPIKSGWSTDGAAAVVLGALALITLLAALNAANLLMASVVARRSDLAVRSALGASTARISRQLVIEGLVVGALSGTGGLLLGYWSAPVLARIVQVPEYTPIAPGAATVIFTALTAIGVGLCIGSVAAFYWLRSGSRLDWVRGASAIHPARRLRGFLSVQAGISTLFLIIAMLFARADRRVTAIEYGFDIDRVVEVSTSGGRQSADPERPWNELLSRLDAVPGVEMSALSRFSPLMARPDRTIHEATVSADYFSAMGLRVVQGRSFMEGEVAEPVALITEKVARDYWGSDSPIGDTLRRVSPRSAAVMIIGVVRDSVTNRLGWPENGVIYRPLTAPQPGTHILIRFRMPVTAESLRIVESVVAPRRSQEGIRIWPLARYRAMEIGRVQRLKGLVTVVSGVTLLLAVIGVVGVTTFGVGQRTREIAVRLAVGATPSRVLSMLVRDSVKPVLPGLAGGVVLAGIAGGLLRNFLAGISSWDPMAASAAVALFTVATIVAVWVSTRRVVQIDPARTLRE